MTLILLGNFVYGISLHFKFRRLPTSLYLFSYFLPLVEAGRYNFLTWGED